MTPLAIAESAWNPAIDAAALQAAIENAPSSQIYPGQKPPPLRNDSGIQEAMAALFQFVGLGDLTARMIGYAQSISTGVAQKRAAAGRPGDSGDSGVLIALGIGGTAGFTKVLPGPEAFGGRLPEIMASSAPPRWT